MEVHLRRNRLSTLEPRFELALKRGGQGAVRGLFPTAHTALGGEVMDHYQQRRSSLLIALDQEGQGHAAHHRDFLARQPAFQQLCGSASASGNNVSDSSMEIPRFRSERRTGLGAWVT